MRAIILTLLLITSLRAHAQIEGEGEIYLKGDRIEASFMGGGIEKFDAYVRKQFDRSKITKPGKMVAQFTVDTDGSLKDIRMVEMIDTPSAMEMIRILNASPKWQPAQRGGKPISITVKYPLVFRSKS